MIYTIGYLGLTLETLVRIMDERKITLLVDIRSVPQSRYSPAFNRGRLQTYFGPRYVWKGDLLGGKNGQCASEEGLAFLYGEGGDILLSTCCPILLMCMEKDPLKCHRFQDIGVRLLEWGVDIFHILPDGTVKTTSELIKERDL